MVVVVARVVVEEVLVVSVLDSPVDSPVDSLLVELLKDAFAASSVVKTRMVGAGAIPYLYTSHGVVTFGSSVSSTIV